MTHLLQLNGHLHSNGERNEAQRRTQVSSGRTMMQALQQLWLTKSTSWDEVMLISEEVKPTATAIIELRFSKGIN